VVDGLYEGCALEGLDIEGWEFRLGGYQVLAALGDICKTFLVSFLFQDGWADA
jgi:hypothetical protein